MDTLELHIFMAATTLFLRLGKDFILGPRYNSFFGVGKIPPSSHNRTHLFCCKRRRKKRHSPVGSTGGLPDLNLAICCSALFFLPDVLRCLSGNQELYSLYWYVLLASTFTLRLLCIFLHHLPVDAEPPTRAGQGQSREERVYWRQAGRLGSRYITAPKFRVTISPSI